MTLMKRIPSRQCVWSGLLAVAAALAPAPAQQDPPPAAGATNKLEVLAKSRVEIAAKMYELAWLYYSENRIDAGDVYGYSRLMLMAEQDLATDKPGHIKATQGHLDRMTKLWKKVARVKKLGFSNTLDVNEAEYYQKEAEYWVAREEAWEEK
jgi:hypothetical protein